MSFTEATAVHQQDPHTYAAHLHPDWVIGSVPHGGIVTSTILSAVRSHFSSTLSAQSQPHTLSLHLDFLRRTQVGPATITIRDVKLGRQTSVVHVTLRQGSREEVVGYVTNSDLRAEEGPGFATGWALRPAPPPADLAGLEAGTDGEWAEKGAWPLENFRKATTRIRSWFPRRGQGEGAVSEMWVCLRDGGERWTDVGLGFLVDTFPQLLERHLMGGVDPYALTAGEGGRGETVAGDVEAKFREKALFWYPTLLLNLEVKKALPEEGVKFLYTRVQAKTIRDGRYDLEVVVLDDGGDVVALSHHVCFAVSAARNVAARRKTEGETKL